MNRRIKGHKCSKVKRGIDAAIAKYGWEIFTVEVLETCPVSKLNEREIFFIAALNTKAPNGYNLTDGGDGNPNPSEETRAKISASNIGKKHTPEAKAKISVKLTGQKRSPETRARMSVAQKAIGNRPPSQKGRKRSPETCARNSANKGKKRSPKTCAKISAGLKAAWARKKALETRGDS